MQSVLDAISIKQIIAPILIIVFSFIIYFILASFIKKIFKFKTKKINIKKQQTLSTFFINILRYLIIIIAFLMILSVFGINTSSIVASLGVASLVLGLALQDMVKDFVSGVALVLDDTYNVGDWVTINTFNGEVISLGMKTTRVKAYNGDILVVNNGSITQVINHSISNSVAIVDVSIAYEEDIEKVEKILSKLCKELDKKLKNLKGEVQLLGVESLSELITFRIVAEVLPQKQFETQRDIKRYVKLELDKNKITTPYQKVVLHNG